VQVAAKRAPKFKPGKQLKELLARPNRRLPYLAQSQLKISFLLPEQNSDWAGQALYAWFPDGLLSSNPKNSLTPFSGWPKSGLKNLEELKARSTAWRKPHPRPQ